MTGRITSSLGRRAIRAAAALALAGCSAAIVAPPASAMCSNATRTVHFVEFAEGSDALPPNLKAAFDARLAPDLGTGRYVDSYTILASGDLAEGAEWDGAAAEARAADRRLGERRAAALEAMVREGSSTPLDADRVRVTVRENRQVFSDEQLAADPALNQRIRAGIMAEIRDRTPRRKKGEPVPVC